MDVPPPLLGRATQFPLPCWIRRAFAHSSEISPNFAIMWAVRIQREFGNFSAGRRFRCALSCRLWGRIFPLDFPRGWPFPGHRTKRGCGSVDRMADAETSKDVFRLSVGNSSAKTECEGQNRLPFLGTSWSDLCAHNPEVVGSNPSPATKSKDSQSQDCESFFAFRHHSSLDGSIRV